MRRRDALVIGGLMATAIAIPPILRRIPSDFQFEPLTGFEGFRRLSSGKFSGRIDPYFGLGTPADSTQNSLETAEISPCLALFGSAGWSSGQVPVAIFSDFNCPYCRVLEARLTRLRDEGAPIRLVWHEMPLLGPSSMRYAQAAVAARLQGKEQAARAYLSQKAFQPGVKAMNAMEDALSLPRGAIEHEVSSTRVQQEIARSLSLGRRLAIPGTPGTMIGRTLVIGAIMPSDLSRLIRLEASEQQEVCP